MDGLKHGGGQVLEHNGVVREGPPSGSDRFIERFADLLVTGGVARMPARVFAALMVSEAGSMTAAELADRLQVSPAAVSGAVRYLTGVQMIERRRPLGSRRDEYRLHDDQWYELVMQRDSLLLAWSTQMRDGVVAVGADTAAGRRMAVTAAFFDFLYNDMQTLMERWRAHRRAMDLSD
jgi:predicted transcriptional regulator